MDPSITLLSKELDFTRQLVLEAVADLSPRELLRPMHGPFRSVARLLGMVTVADRAALVHLDAGELPEVPYGFEARFAPWGIGDDEDIAEWDVSLPSLYARHRTDLIHATESLEPGQLDARLEVEEAWDEDGLFRFGTLGEMVLSLSGYTSFLMGEFMIARLALGKAPVKGLLERELERFQHAARPDERKTLGRENQG